MDVEERKSAGKKREIYKKEEALLRMRLSKEVSVPSMSQVKVPVVKKTSGLFSLKSIQEVVRKYKF